MPTIIMTANQSHGDTSRVTLSEPPAGERDDERAAIWLYEWARDALRPTGELLAARITTPAVVRPRARGGPVRRLVSLPR